MPKTNAAGVPSWADARGTDETATNAAGETYLLDPTATVNDEGKIVDVDGLTIEGDDAEQFESREEREQREQREREEGARRRTDETMVEADEHRHESGDFEANKGRGKFDASPLAVAGTTARKSGDGDASAKAAKNDADRGNDDSGVTSSVGTSSKGSSKASAKTIGSN
jgi:hypothetical protein